MTSPATFRAASEADLPAAAHWLLEALGGRRVVLLDGEMGAGKTTFTRAVGAALGVLDNVASPTYGLVHEYRTATDQPVYHFDLYRLRSPREAEELGIFEYFDSGHLCLLEWPDRLGYLLDDLPPAVRLAIAVDPDDDARTFTLGSWSDPGMV